MTVPFQSFLGFSFANCSAKKLVHTLSNRLKQPGFQHIVTLNPEIFSRLNNSPALKAYIQTHCWCTADGMGIRLISRLTKNVTLKKCAGLDICDTLLDQPFTFYFVGADPHSLKECVQNLRQRFPQIRIVGTQDGYFSDDSYSRVIDDIKMKRPDIIWVGMGFPKQDLFLQACAKQLEYGIGIGIGGVLDIYSGQKKRVATFWRSIGLEWLFQGVLEPQRIKRWHYLGPLFLIALFQSFRKSENTTV